MAPIVEAAPKTGAARKHLELFGDRIEAKIVSRHEERFRLGMIGRTNLSAIAAARSVDVIVQAPDQGVHDGLHVELSETGEDFLAEIRLAIAVRVFQIPKVGRGGDKHSSLPARHTRGPGEAVGENSGLIENAVTIRVLQQA